MHKFKVQYFQRKICADLIVKVVEPEGEKQPIPEEKYYH